MESIDLSRMIQGVLLERDRLRRLKDFESSDQLKKLITRECEGISIEDNGYGTVWVFGSRSGVVFSEFGVMNALSRGMLKLEDVRTDPRVPYELREMIHA